MLTNLKTLSSYKITHFKGDFFFSFLLHLPLDGEVFFFCDDFGACDNCLSAKHQWIRWLTQPKKHFLSFLPVPESYAATPLHCLALHCCVWTSCVHVPVSAFILASNWPEWLYTFCSLLYHHLFIAWQPPYEAGHEWDHFKMWLCVNGMWMGFFFNCYLILFFKQTVKKKSPPVPQALLENEKTHKTKTWRMWTRPDLCYSQKKFARIRRKLGINWFWQMSFQRSSLQIHILKLKRNIYTWSILLPQ